MTVTFMWATFEMPDGRGTALDVLDRAAARGVDVRLIFWRPDAETETLEAQRVLGIRGPYAVNLRLVDPEFGYGGTEPNPVFASTKKAGSSMPAARAKRLSSEGSISIPTPWSLPAIAVRARTTTSMSNWQALRRSTSTTTLCSAGTRQASALQRMAGGEWAARPTCRFRPTFLLQRGNALVQIQRTIHRGRYTDGRPAPEGPSFDIASGERSIFDQYCAAIGAAQRSIYIENQYITVPEIVACLHRALQRGVEVVLLMPAEPDSVARYVAQEQQAFFEAWAALGAYEHFTLAGIAGLNADGRRTPVYVHAKLMLVDDVWATIGSCNLHRYSLFGNGEMNAAFWSPDTVRAFRCELFQEHLDQDTSRMDDRAALQSFRKVALENRRRFNAGNHDWQGLAFTLDPASYGY